MAGAAWRAGAGWMAGAAPRAGAARVVGAAPTPGAPCFERVGREPAAGLREQLVEGRGLLEDAVLLPELGYLVQRGSVDVLGPVREDHADPDRVVDGRVGAYHVPYLIRVLLRVFE